MMAYRAACEMSEQIAGIVSIAGSMNLLKLTCNPSKKIPILHIHHEKDPVVKFFGGFSSLFGHHSPVIRGLEKWARINGCDEGYSTIDQGNGLKLIKWNNCKEKSKILLYKNSDTNSSIKSYHS